MHTDPAEQVNAALAHAAQGALPDHKVDTAKPTLESAMVVSTTNTLTLIFSEDLNTTAPAASAFTDRNVDTRPPVPVWVAFDSHLYTVEESMTDSLTVWLNKDPERTLTIPIWKTYDGGVSFTDFTFPPEVTFTSGEIFKELTFTATQDQQDENGERVGFEIREAAPRGDSGLSPPEHGVHCRRRRGGQRLHQRHQRSAGRERNVHAGAGDAAHRRRHRHPVVQGGTGDVLSAHNHLCAQRLEQAKDGYGGVGAVHGVAFHAGVGVRARCWACEHASCDAHPHSDAVSHAGAYSHAGVHRYDCANAAAYRHACAGAYRQRDARADRHTVAHGGCDAHARPGGHDDWGGAATGRRCRRAAADLAAARAAGRRGRCGR